MKFKDKDLQNSIEESGYVKVPFLNMVEINELDEFIHNETPLVEMANDFGFIQGVCINDKQLKVKLDEKLRAILLPKCEEYLEEFKALIFTALGKGAKENSQLDIHQDWSLVDETKFFSLSLWIPLIDSNVNNGAVHILEGSHKTYKNKRGGSIPSIFGNNANELIEKMKPIEMKAGDALIFDQRLAHFSPRNKTTEVRLSVISSLVPTQADILQYYLNDEKKLEVYKMPDDFFFDFEDFMLEKESKPKGIKLKEISL